MTRLEELNSKIHEKRGKLFDILKSKPNKDFTTEELATIKGLNDELAPIVAEQEQWAKVDSIVADTEAYMSKQQPVKETLPGAGMDTKSAERGGQPIGIKLGNGEYVSLRD